MVSCVHYTSPFFIFGTQSGSIFLYHISESSPTFITELCHVEGGIIRIWPNQLGTRIIFEDERQIVYFYNPLNNQEQQISTSSGLIEDVIWNEWDPHIFSLVTKRTSDYTYIYTSVTRSVKRLPHSINQLNQSTNIISKEDNVDSTKIKTKFEDNLSMVYLDKAWLSAITLNNKTIWETLAGGALKYLEIQVAIKAYEESKNVVNLTRLYEMEEIEEQQLLLAEASKFLQDYTNALKCYRKLSRNKSACTLLCHLQNWNQVVDTNHVDSKFSSFLPTNYGHFLELHDMHHLAYSSYEEKLKQLNTNPIQQIIAQAGMTRVCIQNGDLWKGRQMATSYNYPILFCECAMLVKRLNLLQDVAELYELGLHFQVAAMLYVALKSFTKIAHIAKVLTTPKILISYAKILEGDERYKDASAYYEVAEDYINVIKIQLHYLKNPSKAYSLLHKIKSIEGAGVVTLYCKSVGNYEGAIEFLFMQNKLEEASILAKQHGLVDAYFNLVKDIASESECYSLAKYYECIEGYEKASIMFSKCGEHEQALRLILQLGTHEAMEQAIDMVGKLRHDNLTNQLLDYFMGEMDQCGLKGPQYIFSLHIVLGNYEQATRAASQIATQEQEMGNYKVAHQQLLQFHKKFTSLEKCVPCELSKQLMLLHSYILVKSLVRIGDHKSSARMLMRVAQRISQFPAHINPILISTVIECQRAGLKKTAYSYASMLLRQDISTKDSISNEHKKLLANIIRKYEDIEEEEPFSPCPFCKSEISETQLECVACNSNIPYCIATGRHMVRGNWTQCPNCNFPALKDYFLKVVEIEKVCPMCLTNVDSSGIQEIDELDA